MATPRYFLDTNVLLDGVFARPPHNMEAANLLAHGAYRRVRLVTTSMSLAVLLGKLQKKRSSRKSGPRLNDVRSIMLGVLGCFDEVVPVDKGHFISSVNSGFEDLEDGTLYFAAISSGPITAIVTENAKDFEGRVGNIPLFTSPQALKEINSYLEVPKKRRKK